MKKLITLVFNATTSLIKVLAQKFKPKVVEGHQFLVQETEGWGVTAPISVITGSYYKLKKH